MDNWDPVREKIQEAFSKKDPKSKSTLTHLNKIIGIAEEWEINPAKALYAAQEKPSNLREIIKEARKAIRKEDKTRLEELFTLAAKETNKDLRLTIRNLDLEQIYYELVPGKSPPRYLIEIDQDQLDRIRENTKLHYEFVEKE